MVYQILLFQMTLSDLQDYCHLFILQSFSNVISFALVTTANGNDNLLYYHRPKNSRSTKF